MQVVSVEISDMRPLVYVLFVLFTLSLNTPAEPRPALEVFKSGDYKSAIPLLEAQVSAEKDNALAAAALLSSLVYEGKLEQASALSQQLAQRFPDSPEALAARAEFHYYMGEMAEAEKLTKTALRTRDTTPRAYYGLYRIYRAASMYRSARLMCLRAHELDPEDALITCAFLRYATPELRKQKFNSFIQEHPWFYENYERELQNSSQVQREIEEQKLMNWPASPSR